MLMLWQYNVILSKTKATFHQTSIDPWNQFVPLATSPKPLSSEYSFGLVKIIQIQYIL